MLGVKVQSQWANMFQGRGMWNRNVRQKKTEIQDKKTETKNRVERATQ